MKSWRSTGMIPRGALKPTSSTSSKSSLYWPSWLGSLRISLLGCGVIHSLTPGLRMRIRQRCIIAGKKNPWDRFKSLVVELSSQTPPEFHSRPPLLLPPPRMRRNLAALINNLAYCHPATNIQKTLDRKIKNQRISFFWNRPGQRWNGPRNLRSSSKRTNELKRCSGLKHGVWRTTFQSLSTLKNSPIPLQRSSGALWSQLPRMGFVFNFGYSRRNSNSRSECVLDSLLAYATL